MKKIYLFTTILLITFFQSKAQMGINKDGSVAHPSAMFDIKASSNTNAKGLLMPRVADHTVITSPATGLMVFNTTTNTFWYFNGLAWTDMGNGGSSGAWLLEGNNIYTNNNKVGLNTATPQTTLDIKGDGFLVSQKTKLTTEDPNNHQYNMPLSSVTYTDAAGILYDPSGPSANYPSGNINTTTTIYTYVPDVIGIKLTFEAFDTEANGDSILIMNGAGTTINKYSGNTLPPDFYYNGSYLQIKFKTNGNSIVGQGFKIKWQRIDKDGVSTPISGIIGNNAYFDTSKGAFRSGNLGQYSTEAIGNNSVAIGLANRASGFASIAMGNNNNASGYNSVALGSYTKASGDNAVATGVNTTATGQASTAIGSYTNATGNYATSMGYYTNATSTASFASGYQTKSGGYASTSMGNNTNASGSSSTALGNSSRASGEFSTAMGIYSIASSTASFASGNQTISGGYASTSMGNVTNASGYASTSMGNNTNASGYISTAMGASATASGSYSTAMGSNVNANSEGSFAIGDSPNSSNLLYSQNSNSFNSRFRNGYYLYTSATLGTGAILYGGSNSWSSISDSTKKENFLSIDGENVLKKIANMRTVTWNYKGQDPKNFRHYGPMAQEFFSAFGRDKLGIIGNDTTVASADFDGVNFTAIKALEKRTSELQTENESLKKRLAILEKSSSEILSIKAEMEQLKAFLIPEKEKITVKKISDK